MVLRYSTCVMASLILVTAAAACSDNRAEERPTTAAADRRPAAGGGDMVKVEGCLNGGADGRVVLTAAPDPLGRTAARVGGDRDRDTHSYVLAGGDNLQSHFGKRVEVTGELIGKTQDVEQQSRNETQSAPASSDSRTPTVKTTEEVDIEVRQLRVAGVRELAPTCEVTP
jgi:hypothetical protein